MSLLSLFVAFFGCGMGWLMVRKNPSKKAWTAALLFSSLGIFAGSMISSSDQRQRRETLYEVMAEGSLEVPVGADAPVRRLPFLVAHPGIGHTLMVSPSSYDAAPPQGDSELAFRLLDPQGREVVRDQRIYAVRRPGRTAADWEAAYFPFIPSKAGEYVLEVTILTVGVPHVHVRVVDPKKTDGQRIPGF